MSEKANGNPFSRRDFLKLGAAASASAIFTTINEKAHATFNTGAFWKGSVAASQSATIGQSLRFRASNTAYLSRTFLSATSATTGTSSTWVKRSNLGSYGCIWSASNYDFIRFHSDDSIEIAYLNNAGYYKSDAKFRDPSAWYHVVLVFDTTNGTESERMRLYVNNVRISISGAGMSQNAVFQRWNVSGYTGDIGDFQYNHTYMIDGYMTQVCFVDGQALSPSYFGQADSTTGEWKPKSSTAINSAIAGTSTKWGKNGFMLEFADNSAATATAIGKDTATIDGTYHTAANNWTPSGIYLTTTTDPQYDSMLDSPSNGTSGTRPVGNYATLNPLNAIAVNGGAGIGSFTISDGCLVSQEVNSSNTVGTVQGTIGVSSGKWYWEVYCTSVGGSYGAIGVKLEGSLIGLFGSSTGDFAYRTDGTKNNGTAYGTALSTNNIVGVALDLTAGTIEFFRNNATQGVAFSGLSGTYFPACGDQQNASANTFTFNFGQRPFTYTPPTGFKALCTANLPDPTIKKPSDHFNVLTYTGNGGLKNVTMSGSSMATGYPSTVYTDQISNSLRFRASNNAYLERTCGSATSTTVWTLSFWIKRGKLGGGHTVFSGGTSNSNNAWVAFDSNDKFDFYNYVSSSITARRTTRRSFKDTTNWYHFVLSSNGSTWLKLYVNGVEVTDFSDTSGSNTTAWLFTSSTIRIGAEPFQFTNTLDGYLANVCYVDGAALAAASFGQFDSTYTSVWKPLSSGQIRTNVTGSGGWGTNGFMLMFNETPASSPTTIYDRRTSDSATGSSANWSSSGLSSSGSTNDWMIDSPTNAASATRPVGNYCTLNPLAKRAAVGNTIYSYGNLRAINASGVAGDHAYGSTYVSSGKWYWEVIVAAIGTNPAIGVDTGKSQGEVYTDNIYYYFNGQKYVGTSGSAYGASWTTGDVIGVALDLDGNTITFHKQTGGAGAFVSQGAISFTPVGPLCAYLVIGANNGEMIINFGQTDFNISSQGGVPSGYKSLCAANFSAPSSSQWTPGLVWIKDRTTAYSHAISDSVRGAFQMLASDSTAAETTAAQGIQNFYPGGFTVGSDNTTGKKNDNYISWMWRAGSAPVLNTQGSITSLVSANTTSGFSIVQYVANATTGATVGHGLGVAPAMMILKPRNVSSSNWIVYHQSYGNAGGLVLNLTNGAQSQSGWWNTTTPGQNVFTLGGTPQPNYGDTNYNSGYTFMAYCFAEVSGFSKFGSFIGNGLADGPYIWCGFRPAFILIKQSSSSGDWSMIDCRRQTYNDDTGNPVVWADLTNVESDVNTMQGQVDITSNGFKLRSNHSSFNTSSATIIFAAFAEMPFKYANAR